MKYINKIFLSLFIFSNIQASLTIKKTYIQPRPINTNIAIEKIDFYDQIKNKENNNLYFNLQKTAFYQAAIKGADLGKYFAVDGTNKIVIEDSANASTIIADQNKDILSRFLLHKAMGYEQTFTGDVILNPKQEAYGCRIDLFTYLKKPLQNCFLKLSIPFVKVSNNIHLDFDNTQTDTRNNSLKDFFSGQRIDQEAHNKQDALIAAKLENKKSKFGISDIDIQFGYSFIKNLDKHFFASISLTIPTSNKPTGEYLFEPIYGNGKHFALGCNIDGSFRLWKRSIHKAKLYYAANYKYLFRNTEKRTIPLNSISYPWTHYYLAGQIGQAAGGSLFPLANVLTQDLNIYPGNMLDMMLNFEFKAKKFVLNTGYNLFYKEKEHIKLKTSWNDYKYGIAKQDYNVLTTPFSTDTAIALDGATKTITSDQLNLNGATTPGQLTNKFFGYLGYKFLRDKKPISIGMGASYEFATSNYELEGYAFWLKGSITF